MKKREYNDRHGYSRWKRDDLIDRLVKFEEDFDNYKKKTVEQIHMLEQVIESIQEDKVPEPSGHTIKNCTFTGVHWDRDAVRAVETVAVGLKNLTELFKNQRVEMESMIKIGSDHNTIADSMFNLDDVNDEES